MQQVVENGVVYNISDDGCVKWCVDTQYHLQSDQEVYEVAAGSTFDVVVRMVNYLGQLVDYLAEQINIQIRVAGTMWADAIGGSTLENGIGVFELMIPNVGEYELEVRILEDEEYLTRIAKFRVVVQ